MKVQILIYLLASHLSIKDYELADWTLLRHIIDFSVANFLFTFANIIWMHGCMPATDRICNAGCVSTVAEIHFIAS